MKRKKEQQSRVKRLLASKDHIQMICQNCFNQSNNPSYCHLAKCPVGRKDTCDLWRFK